MLGYSRRLAGILLGAAIASPAAPIAAGAQEPNVIRYGGDYSIYRQLRGGWQSCMRACETDSRCAAWTYIETVGQCRLKEDRGERAANACCTSGVVTRAQFNRGDGRFGGGDGRFGRDRGDNRRPPRGERENPLRPAGTTQLNRWESDWIADDNNSNHTVRIRHQLRQVPSSVTVWFRSPEDGPSVYPVVWSADNTAGNPISIEFAPSHIILQISESRPLHGVWTAQRGGWHRFDRGEWKVVVIE